MIHLRKTKNKKAFTLVEILITLSIIGVIAAMTIPIIVNQSSQSEVKAKLKETSSLLLQSFAMIKSDNGNTLKSVFLNPANLISQLSTKISAQKICTSSNMAECFPSYSIPSGEVRSVNNAMILANNISIAVSPYVFDSNCATTSANGVTYVSPICTEIYVDLNGLKKPNVESKDVFTFLMTQEGIVPSCDDTTGWCQQNFGCGLGSASWCRCFSGGKIMNVPHGGQGCTAAALGNPDAYFDIAW